MADFGALLKRVSVLAKGMSPFERRRDGGVSEGKQAKCGQ